MRQFSTAQTRLALMIATIAAVGMVGIPLIGTAQDSTPGVDRHATEQLAYGEAIYTSVCIACHQPDGMGIQGIYLPLNNNPLLTGDDPTYFISTVLTGRGGMPSFAYIYDDQQIASVLSYVRQAWDNDAGPVTVEQVAEVRADVWGTPIASPTPEGQRPGGNTTGAVGPHGTPESNP